MRSNVNLWVVFATGICLTACGSKSSPPAGVKDIGSPGQADKTNILGWYENDEVVVGKCLDDEPLVRHNCQDILSKKSFAELVKLVDQSITNDIAAMTKKRDEELIKLRDQDPKVKTLRKEITQLDSSITSQKAAIIATEQNIAQSHEVLKKWGHQVEQMEQQILEVTRRIAADPSNQELIRLRDQLNAERTRYVAGRDATQANITEQNATLLKGQANLKACATQLQLKQAELSHALATLPETSQDLEKYNLDINGFMAERSRQQVIFSELRDSALVYRTNTMTDMDSRVIKRIFFNMRAATFSRSGVFQDNVTGVLRMNIFDGRSGVAVTPRGNFSGIGDGAPDYEYERIAKVACHQAGFLGDASFSKVFLKKFELVTYLECGGTEESLLQCGKTTVSQSQVVMRAICAPI